MNIYTGLFLSALTGILLALSGISSGIFAWIALVPIFIALEQASIRRSVLYGATGGVFAGVLLFYGVILYGAQYYIILIVCNAVQGILSAATYVELLKKIKAPLLKIFIPTTCWIFFEYLKTLGPLSFPMPLGASQYNFLPLLQLASIAGVYGISLIIVLVNRVLALWITGLWGNKNVNGPADIKTALLASAVIAAILVVTIGWGSYVLRKNPAETKDGIKVSVLQGNIPIQFYWQQAKDARTRDLISDKYFQMSEEALKQKPDILVWPEGAIYQKVMVMDDYRAKITGYAAKNNAFMIIGALGNDEDGYTTNSAYVVSNNGEIAGRYDKVKIIPFIENYKEGKGYFPIATRIGKLGIAICFESTYPQIMRRFAKMGAEILFVLTNDCGFGDSPIASMHAKDTILRAVENRRYLVRADQAGVSLIVDPFGRVVEKYNGRPYDIIEGTVRVKNGTTPYTRFGDLLPIISAILSFGIIARKTYFA